MHCGSDYGTGLTGGSNILLQGRSWHRLAPDIELAARGTLPVLISGRPETALTIVRAIATAANLDPVADVLIVDAVGAAELFMTVTVRDDPRRGTLLVLREIHRFSAAQQAQ